MLEIEIKKQKQQKQKTKTKTKQKHKPTPHPPHTPLQSYTINTMINGTFLKTKLPKTIPCEIKTITKWSPLVYRDLGQIKQCWLKQIIVPSN